MVREEVGDEGRKMILDFACEKMIACLGQMVGLRYIELSVRK